MNITIEYLKNTFKENQDFMVREIKVNKKESIYIAFFESLIDSKALYNYTLKNFYNHLRTHKRVKEIRPLILSPKIKPLNKDEETFYYLENGFALIIYKDEKYAIEVKAELDRGIAMSQTEPNMYGPKDAFCENFQKNLGLLKRRIKNKNLKVETAERGVYTKTKVGLIYIDGKIDKNALLKIKDTLNQYQDDEITDSYNISQDFIDSKIFPTIFKTEKPALAAKFLLKGHIVIAVDNSPFMLVMDARLNDFVNPYTTDKFVKVLRYACLILTVLTPALYIAIINFNQETLPTSLLINFSEQRSGVPFPAIVEAVIMLLICEVLRESDIRFPNTYGSSASILGALLLGEAAVSAGIVSPIMIIIVAISFITSLIFTETKLVGAIRIMRLSFLFIASVLGLYGLSVAVIACLSLISNVKLNEGEYI